MLLIDREPSPVFFKVTLCAGLVVATVWLANVRLVVDKLATGVRRVLACANVPNVERSTTDTRINFFMNRPQSDPMQSTLRLPTPESQTLGRAGDTQTLTMRDR